MLERHARRLQSLSKEHDLVTYQSFSDMVSGVLMAWRGPRSGTDRFREGFSKLTDTGVRLFMPTYVVAQAGALLELDDVAAARRVIGRARELVSATGQRWAEAEIHRVEGDLYLAERNPTAGIASYRNAIDVARQQGAKSLELRASMSLARHWANRGERGNARDLLAPVHDWFTERLDTPDLKRARMLLAELMP